MEDSSIECSSESLILDEEEDFPSFDISRNREDWEYVDSDSGQSCGDDMRMERDRSTPMLVFASKELLVLYIMYLGHAKSPIYQAKQPAFRCCLPLEEGNEQIKRKQTYFLKTFNRYCSCRDIVLGNHLKQLDSPEGIFSKVKSTWFQKAKGLQLFFKGKCNFFRLINGLGPSLPAQFGLRLNKKQNHAVLFMQSQFRHVKASQEQNWGNESKTFCQLLKYVPLQYSRLILEEQIYKGEEKMRQMKEKMRLMEENIFKKDEKMKQMEKASQQRNERGEKGRIEKIKKQQKRSHQNYYQQLKNKYQTNKINKEEKADNQPAQFLNISCGVVSALYLLVVPKFVEVKQSKVEENTYFFRRTEPKTKEDEAISQIQKIFLKNFDSYCQVRSLQNKDEWQNISPSMIFERLKDSWFINEKFYLVSFKQPNNFFIQIEETTRIVSEVIQSIFEVYGFRMQILEDRQRARLLYDPENEYFNANFNLFLEEEMYYPNEKLIFEKLVINDVLDIEGQLLEDCLLCSSCLRLGTVVKPETYKPMKVIAYPSTQDLKTKKEQISSLVNTMLNKEGGIIVFGTTQNDSKRIICGEYINFQKQEEIKYDLESILLQFYPYTQILEAVNLSFIPVVNSRKGIEEESAKAISIKVKENRGSIQKHGKNRQIRLYSGGKFVVRIIVKTVAIQFSRQLQNKRKYRTQSPNKHAPCSHEEELIANIIISEDILIELRELSGQNQLSREEILKFLENLLLSQEGKKWIEENRKKAIQMLELYLELYHDNTEQKYDVQQLLHTLYQKEIAENNFDPVLESVYLRKIRGFSVFQPKLLPTVAVHMVRTQHYYEAIELYDRCLKKNPQDISLLLGKGEALILNKNVSEAVQLFEKAVANNSLSSDLYFFLGKALDLVSRQKQAITCYKKGILLRPLERKEKIPIIKSISESQSKIKQFAMIKAKGIQQQEGQPEQMILLPSEPSKEGIRAKMKIQSELSEEEVQAFPYQHLFGQFRDREKRKVFRDFLVFEINQIQFNRAKAKKRQLCEKGKDAKSSPIAFTEVAVYNDQGGVDAVETACINSITIQNKQLGEGAIRYLAGRRWDNLQQLRLSNSLLLLPAISHWEHSTPAQSYLDSMNIGDEDCLHIKRGRWHQLKELSLSGNKVGAEGCRHLAEADWPLQRLNLSVNEVGDEGCAMLAARTWTHLEQLKLRRAPPSKALFHFYCQSLEYNKIVEGVKHISAERFPRLRELQLLGNAITMRERAEEGGEAVSRPVTTLAQHQHLTLLDLGGNKITSIQPHQLPTSLKELRLYSNQLEEVHLQDLKCLEVLWIWGNELASIDLQGNTRLRLLYIYSNPLEISQLPPSIQWLVADFKQIADYDFHPLEHLKELGIKGKEGLKWRDIRNLRPSVDLYDGHIFGKKVEYQSG